MDILTGTIDTPFGAPIGYAQAGSGPDVLLIHGALTNAADMVIALFPTLTERYRVTAFDRPGHGASGRVGQTGSPWRQAELLHAAARGLGIERAVVVGHSFGGAVALSYALQYPEEVTGVIALGPIAFPEMRLEYLLFGPRAMPVAGKVLAMAAGATSDPVLLPLLWRAMFLPQEMPEKFRLAFPFDQAGHPDHTRSTGEDTLMMGPGLARSALNYPLCKTPVRVMVGTEDKVVNPGVHGRPLSWILPRGELEQLDGLGHMIHHFAQDRILHAVDDLARVEA
jgi:pimeloyl-ACP methyl ester carboxylesterase